ncbi:WD40 repeat-like protein [Hortaea werneckii]|nr:WD40 repeat-like protein [Hortaea werneckii]KAI6998527.1 WD40 repeat-like protein [Hortaea werneckii]KAI7149270.1 WD40 repeat-like protein [Hortaea werneckii]KAI7178960.1 WD40 repeat-like protein [Hortaea werneckii]
MSGEKRSAADSFGSNQLVKRQRSEAELNGGQLTRANGSSALVQGNAAAPLQAPVMQLNGHSAEITTTRFSPSGSALASGSMDRDILLWRTAGDCENYGKLSGHKSAVLDLQWSRDGGVIYSASADATVASWDLERGERIRRHQGHEEVVSAIDVSRRGEEFIVSACDDGFIGLWDPRAKAAMDFLEVEGQYPVTAVALGEAGNEVFSGGIDNEIKVWDLRMHKVAYTLQGHTDTVTSVAVSPDSQSLLSFSHDGTARTWDIRPFAPENRLINTFDGAQVGLEKNLIRACWDSDGRRIAAGGGDGTVTVWEAKSGKMLHKLPGHKGTVNDVRISPDGGMVVSGSTDRTMLLGELPR